MINRRRALIALLTIFIAGCTMHPVVPSIVAKSTPFARTISPAPDPVLNPLAIDAMRQRDYPGSDLIIEQTLAPSSNYRRYIASYRSDGLKIFALLTVPNGPRPKTGWPVIIFNHGYIPPAQYRTTERYVAYVDAIARSGYIVFKSDYRGHGSSEGQPSSAYGSPGYTVDVLNAVTTLQRYPDADPNRIGMWGHSMGGNVTLRALVVDPRMKVAVIWAGVTASYQDLLENWHPPPGSGPPPSTTRSWRQDWVAQYGTPEQNPGFWNSISPMSYLGDITAPIEIHHGTADVEVPLAFSQKLASELQAKGKTVELHPYPGSDHNIAQGFSLAMARSIAFFDRYLK
ncbi:MAG TPA: alpha/beta fold hydrolase [Candidatus Dormibacteraeota bacterium]|nr:alpha/beta fold hydrolase [Candidatus Dormibacteraeota bacterium]